MNKTFKWIKITLIAVLCLSLSLLFVACDSSAKSFEYSIENGQVTIIKYVGEDVEVEIPSKIKGKPVVEIAEEAFYDLPITSVSIPSSIEKIGDNAFWGCVDIERVNITDLSKWLDISFGGWWSNPGGDLYLNNEKITELIIPIGTTKIKEYAFWGCSSITSIIIPGSVVSIGDKAFEGCSYVSSVIFDVGSNLATIGNQAFHMCENLETIIIPSSIQVLGDMAFYLCTSLNRVFFESNSRLTTIGYGCFGNCYPLQKIVIPSTVTSMGTGVFEDCENLRIYCEMPSEPTGWDKSWNGSNYAPYWYSESRPSKYPYQYWHYVNGVATTW